MPPKSSRRNLVMGSKASFKIAATRFAACSMASITKNGIQRTTSTLRRHTTKNRWLGKRSANTRSKKKCISCRDPMFRSLGSSPGSSIKRAYGFWQKFSSRSWRSIFRSRYWAVANLGRTTFSTRWRQNTLGNLLVIWAIAIRLRIASRRVQTSSSCRAFSSRVGSISSIACAMVVCPSSTPWGGSTIRSRISTNTITQGRASNTTIKRPGLSTIR